MVALVPGSAEIHLPSLTHFLGPGLLRADEGSPGGSGRQLAPPALHPTSCHHDRSRSLRSLGI